MLAPASAPHRRPLLPDGDDAAALDLTGAVLAESANAPVSLAIRLKQLDGLNHNAVVVGRGEVDGEWRILEAIARGCVVRERRLSTGYVIWFEDPAVRDRIATTGDDLGGRGWKYDWWSIAFHVGDFLVWFAPVVLAVASVVTAVAGGPWAVLAVAAVATNLVVRGLKALLPDSPTRKICSELLLDVLRGAGVPVPDELGTDHQYKPTPIDVTRWLLGRADWGGPKPPTFWTRLKRLLGVRYSTKNPGRDGRFQAAM